MPLNSDVETGLRLISINVRIPKIYYLLFEVINLYSLFALAKERHLTN